MSFLLPLNGQNYIIPSPGELGWGSNVNAFFTAIPAGCLQKVGGNFTLSAETDFGGSFGLKSKYLKSRTTNPSSTGVLRLANGDEISWRNSTNTGDLPLSVDASNQLLFNGSPVVGGVSFPLFAPDGGMFAPSYSFSSNPGSGMFYDLATDQIIISSSAGVGLYVDSFSVTCYTGIIDLGTPFIPWGQLYVQGINTETIKITSSASEVTGSGSALLGANSPAITLTDPYKWIKVTLSDLSIAYIPCWK
jgi:hypothetical protein